MNPPQIAKLFLVQGRVQGVGYRNFAQRAASELGLRGYARNLAGGSVEVYAIGPAAALDDFAGLLRQGPRWADKSCQRPNCDARFAPSGPNARYCEAHR